MSHNKRKPRTRSAMAVSDQQPGCAPAGTVAQAHTSTAPRAGATRRSTPSVGAAAPPATATTAARRNAAAASTASAHADSQRPEPTTGRIPIIDILPMVSQGHRPAKAVVGERFAVSATIFGEGHDAIAANVVLRGPNGEQGPWTPLRALPAGDSHVDSAHGGGTDRWVADVCPTSVGMWTFTIEAWKDVMFTWSHNAGLKIAADVDTELMLEEGARLFERAAQDPGHSQQDAQALLEVSQALRDQTRPAQARLAAAQTEQVRHALQQHPLRDLVTQGPALPLLVERERALVGSWYEFFPRSEGARDDQETGQWHSGTFATAALRLSSIAAMGFDVVYLPPIHPIGQINRKGPNNTLNPTPGDPGSPWAIGSAQGGHDAVHPDLGTLEDFDAFVATAHEHGLEVALDLALQCAPDHPWVAAHPEWFTILADGSIAYAENPPKKYQDIYPLNFDRDYEGLYAEILRVVRHWMDHGVRIFRVDNPHTKPVHFWEQLIGEITSTDPDVIFLAEAFTKPPMMHQLAKVGFQQSYTYFTWRTGKSEIEDYLRELSGDAAAYMRPNLFTNTPDILHESLQYGGPAAFKIRAALAATASPSYGIYSGFELYEHVALRPGSEEYLDSEKYQYRPRDWKGAEEAGRSLAPYLTRLNTIRKQHRALQRLRNLTVHACDDPAILAFSKHEPADPHTGQPADTVLVVMNVDPHAVRNSWVHLDLHALGYAADDLIEVTDQITGESYTWGRDAWVQLDPWKEPVHIFTIPAPFTTGEG